MATFNPDAWYAISETRVDNGSVPLGSTLQSKPEGLRVYPLVGQSWQLQPVDNVTGRYLLRTSTGGPQQQLTACYVPDEIHPSKTRACLRRSVSDDSQKWFIEKDGDVTYKIYNVANGTQYVLDVHPGSDLFMSSEIEGKTTDARQPAQHWVFSSRSRVNDGAFSTIYSESSATSTPTTTSTPTATSIPTTTGTSGSISATDPPPTPTPPASSGLSAGAAAGIGVGATVGALAILGVIGFYFWRRRKAKKSQDPLASPTITAEVSGSYPEGGGDYQQVSSQYQQGSEWITSPSSYYRGDQTKQHPSPYSAYSDTPQTAAVHEAPAPSTQHVHEAPGTLPAIELPAVPYRLRQK